MVCRHWDEFERLIDQTYLYRSSQHAPQVKSREIPEARVAGRGIQEDEGGLGKESITVPREVGDATIDSERCPPLNPNIYSIESF